MTIYTGLCVGGPWAGRIVTHISEVCRAAEPPCAPAMPMAAVPANPRNTTFIYRHVKGLSGEFRIDFWVKDGLTAGAAIGALVQAYKDQANGR